MCTAPSATLLIFLSTLSLRRATGTGRCLWHPPSISIHALLAESDLEDQLHRLSFPRFLSTLSLRRATWKRHKAPEEAQFLSTLSLRRATRAPAGQERQQQISIHTLLAETDQQKKKYSLFLGISIHALLAESDLLSWASTAFRRISIHALLAESDAFRSFSSNRPNYFYPRSPCGERPATPPRRRKHGRFLSTLSLRRAT